MKRRTWIAIIAYAFILLLLYTASSKLISYGQSLDDLKRSPFISEFALPLSLLLPLLEISISILLFLPKYRLIGLYSAMALMLLFTVYVGAMVFTLESLPCSCGGLIRKLSWKQHFFFNIFFSLLAVAGIWLHKKESIIEHSNLQLT